MPVATIDLSDAAEQAVARVGDFTVDALGFDPSGRWLAIGAPGRVIVHDIARGEGVAECTAGDDADASLRAVRVAFTRDAARLVVEWNASRPYHTAHSVLEVYATDSGRSLLRLHADDGWIASPVATEPPRRGAENELRRCRWALSADGSTLAAVWWEADRVDYDGSTVGLGAWDLHRAALLDVPATAEVLSAQVRDVVFAMLDGAEQLACLLGAPGQWTASGRIVALDLARGASRAVLSIDSGGIPVEIELDATGRRALVMGEQLARAPLVAVWDLATRLVSVMAAPSAPVRRVAVDWSRGAVYWWKRDPKSGGVVAKLLRQPLVLPLRQELLTQGTITAVARSADGARWALAEETEVTVLGREELEPDERAPRRAR